MHGASLRVPSVAIIDGTATEVFRPLTPELRDGYAVCSSVQEAISKRSNLPVSTNIITVSPTEDLSTSVEMFTVVAEAPTLKASVNRAFSKYLPPVTPKGSSFPIPIDVITVSPVRELPTSVVVPPVVVPVGAEEASTLRASSSSLPLVLFACICFLGLVAVAYLGRGS